jgi:hypothetical protein
MRISVPFPHLLSSSCKYSVDSSFAYPPSQILAADHAFPLSTAYEYLVRASDSDESFLLPETHVSCLSLPYSVFAGELLVRPLLPKSSAAARIGQLALKELKVRSPAR